MRRLAILVLTTALSPAGAAPQTPSARDVAAFESKRGTAIVRGRVTDAETGDPMPGVTLSLSLLGARAQVDTRSDATGAFEFTRVPAGAYALTADPIGKTTHRSTGYGVIEGKPPGKHSTIVLGDGQLFDNADIALPRAFVISARVVDDDGGPVVDMLVKADSFDNRARSSRSRTTDDRGMVRLWGYSPGTYKVCAIPQMGPDRSAAEGFVRTCYPSAAVDGEAQPVTVTNVDPPEVEIRMRRSRFFKISGFVLDSSGALATNARVSFITIEDNSSTSRSTQGEGGAFTIRGVAPGEYYVRADRGSMFSSQPNMWQSGYAAVSIQTADVENLAILMAPPATVRGRLTFEGGPTPSLSGVTIRVDPARNSIAAVGGGSLSPSDVKADLTFEVHGLFGPHMLMVIGLQDWIVKSVKYRGEERINVPTEFRHSDSAAVEIVLSNRPSKLVARVFDDKGQPAEEARLVLFPADPRQWDSLTVMRWAIRGDGNYEFSGLRPAEYFVAVVPDGMGSVNTRRGMEELSKHAERVNVLENDQRTIDLTIRR